MKSYMVINANFCDENVNFSSTSYSPRVCVLFVFLRGKQTREVTEG